MERSIDDPNMSDHIDTARDILGDLDIQAISFFRFYRKLIIGNGVVAVILIGLLIWITLDADGPVSIWLAILFCALSTVPFAPLARMVLVRLENKNGRHSCRTS